MVDPISLGILGASAIGAGSSAYSAYKGNKRAKKAEKQGKGYNKLVKKQFRQATRDRRKYIAANKKYEKDIAAFLKQYGGEKYIKNPALNKEQRSVLKNILSKGTQFLNKKPQKIPKLEKLEKNKEFRRGQRTLKDLLSGEALTGQPLFQAGQNALLEQLGGTPQDYENYKAPLMREFQRDIVPQIAERFAGQGANSGVQAQLGEASADLGERLAALRSGIRERAIERGLGYAQAPGTMRQNALQAGLQYATAPGAVQQQRIQNAMGENAQEFERAYNLNQLGLGTKPWNATFRAATPPPAPQQPAAFNPNQYTPYQNPPSAFSTFASNAASGLGQGIGQWGASRLSNYLNSNPASGNAQGMAGNFAPTSGAGIRGGFGGMNQLNGFRAPAT